jgi:hypothetical protein
MKKEKIIIFALMGLALSLIYFSACEPKDNSTGQFDANLPSAKITGFSPDSQKYSKMVQIFGSGFKDKNLKAYLGNDSVQIISKTADTLTVQLPRICDENFFTVINSFNVTATSATKFIPLFDHTSFDTSAISDTLFELEYFNIKGVNMDFITSVTVGTAVFPINGRVQTPNLLSFKTGDSTITVNAASISFTSRAGDKLPSKGVLIMKDYPSCNLTLCIPDSASPGDTVKFIFDDQMNGYRTVQQITQIQFPKTVSKTTRKVQSFTNATFRFSSPYLLVIIPSDAVRDLLGTVNIFIYGNETTYRGYFYIKV